MTDCDPFPGCRNKNSCLWTWIVNDRMRHFSTLLTASTFLRLCFCSAAQCNALSLTSYVHGFLHKTWCANVNSNAKNMVAGYEYENTRSHRNVTHFVGISLSSELLYFTNFVSILRCVVTGNTHPYLWEPFHCCCSCLLRPLTHCKLNLGRQAHMPHALRMPKQKRSNLKSSVHSITK